jgi:hypothetical protein
VRRDVGGDGLDGGRGTFVGDAGCALDAAGADARAERFGARGVG